MKDHIKAFQISLVVHIAVIVLLLGINIRTMQPEPVMLIDLSDGNPYTTPTQETDGNRRSPFPALHRSNKTPEQASPPLQPPIPEEFARELMRPAEAQQEQQTAGLSEGKEQTKALTPSFEINDVLPPDSGLGIFNAGNSTEVVLQDTENMQNASYLKRHFSYIREIIQRNILYPVLARRMGWEGKVVISFLIMPDGKAINIKIVRSSGKDILDRNAVETVKRASPFPPPPLKAEITVPVVYALQ